MGAIAAEEKDINYIAGKFLEAVSQGTASFLFIFAEKTEESMAVEHKS